MKKLTKRQIEALISAAEAMLAGEEGAGDAQNVKFDVLRRASNILKDELEEREWHKLQRLEIYRFNQEGKKERIG